MAMDTNIQGSYSMTAIASISIQTRIMALGTIHRDFTSMDLTMWVHLLLYPSIPAREGSCLCFQAVT